MLAATAALSFIPPALTLAPADGAFSFNTGWKAGFALGTGAYAALAHRRTLFRKETARAMARGLAWPVCIMLLANLTGQAEFIALGLTMTMADPGVCSVLYQTYHIHFALFTAWLFRREGRYRGTGPGTVALMAAAAAGAALVVLSERGARIHGGAQALAGAGAALAAGILSATAAGNSRWSFLTARGIPGGDTMEKEMAMVLTVAALTNLAAMPLIWAPGAILGEEWNTAAAGWGTVCGLVVNVPANILWRRANVITSNLGVNAVPYAGTALSLEWLTLMGRTSVRSPGLMVLGAALIIAANAAINLMPAAGRNGGTGGKRREDQLTKDTIRETNTGEAGEMPADLRELQEDVTRGVMDGLDQELYPEPERTRRIGDEMRYRIGLSFRRAMARRTEERG